MHKKFLQLAVAISISLTLLAGCTESIEGTESATTDSSIDIAIESGENAESVKNGKCVITPPEEPVACTMQYDPVCGCDGKTYGNACMARGAGVPHSTPGACDENPHL